VLLRLGKMVITAAIKLPAHVGNGWQIMHIHFGKIWAKIHVTGTKKPLSTIE